jgi:hypothetical protein
MRVTDELAVADPIEKSTERVTAVVEEVEKRTDRFAIGPRPTL